MGQAPLPVESPHANENYSEFFQAGTFVVYYAPILGAVDRAAGAIE
jgi:hypothetical protein